MRAARAAVAIAMLLSCSCAGRRAQVDLGLHLAPGQGVRMTVEATQSMTQRAASGDERFEQESTIVYRLTALGSIPDGGLRLEARWERLALRMTMPGSTIAFDSADPGSAAPALEPLALLAGQRFTFVANHRGRVVEVDGLDSVARGLASGDEEIAALFQGLLSEEATRASLEGFMALLPASPVRVGDWWESESVLPVAGGVRTRTRLTLTGATASTCTLRLVAAIGTAGASAAARGLAGSQEGTLEVDRRTGAVTSGRIVQRLEGTIGSSEGARPVSFEGVVRLEGQVLEAGP